MSFRGRTGGTIQALRAVVERLRGHELPVVLVDDGSGPEGREVCAAVGTDGLATVVHHAKNRGKGAACQTGFQNRRCPSSVISACTA